jgi:hypothetical protein
MSRAALAEAEARDQSSERGRECGQPLTLPSVTVEIGGIAILLQPSDPKFCNVLESRYETFASRNAPDAADTNANIACRFEIHLDPRGRASDEDARVTREVNDGASLWHFRRGDFDATWNPQTREGRILQCPNPYSIDTVLRITHSLVLAEEGGFLVHAASAIRNERAYLFAGVSGAGKTTMARLAPPDATVLTDEISYVRRIGHVGAWLQPGVTLNRKFGRTKPHNRTATKPSTRPRRRHQVDEQFRKFRQIQIGLRVHQLHVNRRFQLIRPR